MDIQEHKEKKRWRAKAAGRAATIRRLRDELLFERFEVDWRQREIEQDARTFWRHRAKLWGREATIRRLLDETTQPTPAGRAVP